MFWGFKKEHCSVSFKFVGDKIENVFWENEAKLLKLFKSRFAQRSFLEKVFGATLSWKTNFVSVWKEHFSISCKFLSDDVETISWESEAKHLKLFKIKFGHKKLPKKWFSSNLDYKNECSGHLKRTFFSFLQVFEWRSWNSFLGK